MTESAARQRLAEQLAEQARACSAMGSSLYARLLHEAALDAARGGPTYALLASRLAPGRGGALALRLMAAVHALVLTGRAPQLAAFYPSAGGRGDAAAAWPALRDVLARDADALQPLVDRPCQTNEVGRCAALIWGFLAAGAQSRLPLRMLEVGASAGLSLRWDHFRYGGAGAAWGDAGSPVDLDGLWSERPPHVELPLEVAGRRGCDLRRVDHVDEDGRLTLMASVWADQLQRFERLRGALELARRVPAQVDEASADVWLPQQLAGSRPGLATVVYHSVVIEYMPEPVRRGFEEAIRRAAEAASTSAPLFWVRAEPLSSIREHGVTLTSWPGGEERLLAVCGAHGQDVRRPQHTGGCSRSPPSR